jgi:adenylosuccinate synthase
VSTLFTDTGLHVMAGGQYGSEGKGLLASWLAKRAIEENVPFNGVITSAGPNSGHTSYFGDRKIVLKQLPTFAVHMSLRNRNIPVYFSAGSVIDAEILVEEHLTFPDIPIFIHPCATVILEKDRVAENDASGSIFAVAGTRSGTGAAISRKILRDPSAIYYNHSHRLFPYFENIVDLEYHPYFMEISQGFSLGLNEAKFYPHVTSRECTFMQGMADARLPPTYYKRGYLCFRTYPIRVGNADGFSSGNWYTDQHEITWEDIGLPAEYTTVTKRVRRVATFSWNQFKDSVTANDPTHVFLNYMNYFGAVDQLRFYEKHREVRDNELGENYKFIFGHGPRVEQVGDQDSPRIEGV